ncbi:MAG: glycine--tRNA ligase subunit beta [Proteobacteria bacterium]|nr:glycine--tRNA ligase subunit beta [Pseudomonadota bacterium]
MATLLVELLTEELPPKALKKLGISFGATIFDDLSKQNLVSENASYKTFATPRRLAILVNDVRDISPVELVRLKLMPKHVGIKEDGTPSAALLKKLESLGLDAGHAKKIDIQLDGNMEFIYLHQKKDGITLSAGLQRAIDLSITRLPIPKVMSYQPQDTLQSVNFVRPAHRLVAMHGADVVPIQALGLTSGNKTLGHRFHSNGDVTVPNAKLYESTLEELGLIIPDYEKRKSNIREQLHSKATELKLTLQEDEELLDEVTSLVELPIVYPAQFDKEFLSIPTECLVLTMKTNQKYFPLFDRNGGLAEKFLLVSNMKLEDPSNIVQGNEKVVRPRLADAQFFYQGDINTPLENLTKKLKNVVYHNQLGSQLDRVKRLVKLSRTISEKINADCAKVARAAELCKADLLTGMVGEFPELQGTMGRYYALAQGESPDVADALEQYYRPRFSNDSIPNSPISSTLALAEKMDTLVGIFGIGLIPSGEKDPYALRRQAIGIIRILTEHPIELDLSELISWATKNFRQGLKLIIDESIIKNFIIDRFRGHLKDKGFSIDKVEAILATDSERLHLALPRLRAIDAFLQTDDSIALATANKRIKNILKKNKPKDDIGVDTNLFTTDEELSLHKKIQSLLPVVKKAIDSGGYSDALQALSSARTTLDQFFEKVMVMSDDPNERHNRLALLNQLSGLLNCVGDLSELSI